MIVTLTIPPETADKVRRDERLAAELPAVLGDALAAACAAGGQQIAMDLILGKLGLVSRNPGQGGLAGAIFGEATDRAIPEGFIGVRADSPAAAYASIQNSGQPTITPKHAKALAVPISDQAKQSGGPRAMAGLVFIPRRKSTPHGLVVGLLAEVIGETVRAHWILMAHVTLTATHWWDKGLELAAGPMDEAMASVLNERLVEAW